MLLNTLDNLSCAEALLEAWSLDSPPFTIWESTSPLVGILPRLRASRSFHTAGVDPAKRTPKFLFEKDAQKFEIWFARKQGFSIPCSVAICCQPVSWILCLLLIGFKRFSALRMGLQLVFRDRSRRIWFRTSCPSKARRSQLGIFSTITNLFQGAWLPAWFSSKLFRSIDWKNFLSIIYPCIHENGSGILPEHEYRHSWRGGRF